MTIKVSMRKHRSPGLLWNSKMHTECADPRQLGRGQVDEAQEVIPQHSDFGCGSAALAEKGEFTNGASGFFEALKGLL